MEPDNETSLVLSVALTLFIVIVSAGLILGAVAPILEKNSWTGFFGLDGFVSAPGLSGILKKPAPPAKTAVPAVTVGNNWCDGADITRDGKVNQIDYIALKSKMGVTGCRQSNDYCGKADINRDGKVDSADLQILTGNLSRTDCTERYIAISNCLQLQQIALDLAGNYKLVQDIDCFATRTWNAGQGFEPIGAFDAFDTLGFKGTLDGQGHKITGLYIKRLARDYVGIFGSVSGAGRVKKIVLDAPVVSGRNNVGALSGYNSGIIENCSVNNGLVRGTQQVGGLVGGTAFWTPPYSTHSTIKNCNVSAEVSGGTSVGGLVGYNNGLLEFSSAEGKVIGTNLVGGLIGHNPCGGEIRNSHASGTVEGKKEVGGLVGLDTGILKRSFATGAVSGEESVGGLVGKKQENAIDCFATGNVSGITNVGGLIGYNWDRGIPENCFATGNVSGTTNVGGLIGLNDPYARDITNSFSTGSVSGTNYVGGLIGYFSNNSLGYTIVNSYFNHHSGNPSNCVGFGTADCNAIQDNEPYFYNINNAPLADWNYPPWNNALNGQAFPTLIMDYSPE